MPKPSDLLARIDALSLKERVLLLAAVLAVVLFLWQRGLMRPLEARQAALAAQMSQTRTATASLNRQGAKIVAASATDPDAATRAELAAVRTQITAADRRLGDLTRRLIKPKQMPQVLEAVLQKTQGLKLIALQGLGVKPLVEPAAPVKGKQAETVPAVGVYRHGMRIEFEGGYLQTLAYLRELEGLPWGFFWEGMSFKVEGYPHARGSITVYTLSLDQSWIGV